MRYVYSKYPYPHLLIGIAKHCKDKKHRCYEMCLFLALLGNSESNLKTGGH